MLQKSLLLFLFCILSLAISASAQSVIQRDETTRFAVIGDYGTNSQREAEVAALVQRLAPDFVITVGDNNYPAGQAETIDANIGQYYSSFIGQYRGSYGQGTQGENRFFPALGNHDWETGSVQPYTDYFTLPNNERYYEFNWGAVRLFALDSDPREPDGYESHSPQAQWLQARLATATEAWRIVYMHHPPYSSSTPYMTASANWPYGEWGASLVFAGHAHNYERLDINGVPYIVNGLGGADTYNFRELLAGSQFQFNAAHGAMLVEATANSLTVNFYGIYGRPIASVNANPPAGQWLELDMTQAVQSDGIYSFVLDGTTRNALVFNAVESGLNPPELILETGGEILRFMAAEDATVNNSEPDRQLGENRGLQLLRTNTEHRRIYLQFELSGLSNTIEKARLRLFVNRTDPDNQGGIAVYLSDSNWTDEQIRWTNAPGLIIDDSPIDTFTLQR